MPQSEAQLWVPFEVGVVWSYVSDPTNYPQFLDHLAATEPLGDQTTRWYLKSSSTTPLSLKVVSRLNPAREVSWQTLPGEGSIESSGRLQVEPEDSGTQVSLFYEYRPLGPAVQLEFEPLFQQAEAMAQHDLQALLACLERSQQPPENEDADPVGEPAKTSATANPLESELVNKGQV